MSQRHSQSGVTLVELVVAIVIISVAAAGVMMAVVQTTLYSADPMLREQATAIAQSYMEEIFARELTDPDGGETGGAEAGETRSGYDDVADYNGLSDTSGARDQSGNAVSGLEAYNVAVQVTDTTLNGAPAKRIRVTVTHDGSAGLSIRLVSHRLI